MKKILLITCFFIVNATTYLFADQKINARVDIGENAINLFLNEQYNKIGIGNTISGSVSGINYNITLQLPYIRLFVNEAKVYFGFKIESNVYNGIIEFEDYISFSIPSISNLTVKGVSAGFQNKVQSLNLNSTLKDVIITKWSSLQLEIYPMKLADNINNSDWFVERAISLVDPFFSIDFRSITGKLQITLNSHLKANEYYLVGISKANNKRYLNFSCGSQVKIQEMKVFLDNGSLFAEKKDLGTCPKQGVLAVESPFLSRLPTGQIIIVNVLFENSGTFYVRNYKCIAGLTNYYNPSKIIN